MVLVDSRIPGVNVPHRSFPDHLLNSFGVIGPGRKEPAMQFKREKGTKMVSESSVYVCSLVNKDRKR